MPRADLEPLFQVMRAQPLRGTIPEMRVDFELFLPLVNAGAPAVAREHLGEAIGDGVGVDILVPPGEAPFPVLVYLHGGGWSVGSPASHAKLTRQLCLAAGVLVASVDYRLSPEHPYPTPLRDCVAAVRWVRANAARFGGDPSRIAVGGDSAGGNLSAAVANELRGEVEFRAAVLIYGAFDLRASIADYDRYAAPGGDPVLPKPAMKVMLDAYLSGGADPDDPKLSPIHADLGAFPPSLLLCGDADPLYGDSLHMHDALRRAGRDSVLVPYSGMPHAFMQLMVAEADDAVARSAAFLRERLA